MKRPQTMELVMTPDGPTMNVDQLNAAVYTLQRQVAAMEPWANSVNAALGDHAGHIDHRATVVEAQRVDMVKAKEEHDCRQQRCRDDGQVGQGFQRALQHGQGA